MTRNLFYACVLMACAVLASAWALADLQALEEARFAD